MNVTISMDALYTFLKSLSLGSENERWLADKLLDDANAQQEEETEYISKEEILAGIDAGLKELKQAREGKLKLKSAEELLEELRNER